MEKITPIQVILKGDDYDKLIEEISDLEKEVLRLNEDIAFSDKRHKLVVQKLKQVGVKFENEEYYLFSTLKSEAFGAFKGGTLLISNIKVHKKEG